MRPARAPEGFQEQPLAATHPAGAPSRPNSPQAPGSPPAPRQPLPGHGGLPHLAPGITCHVGQLRGLQAIRGLPVLLGLRPEKGKGALSNAAAKAQPQSSRLGHAPELPYQLGWGDRGSERAARTELAQPSHAHRCFPQFSPLSASSDPWSSEKLSPSWADGHSPQCSSGPARTESWAQPSTRLHAGAPAAKDLVLTRSSPLAACPQGVAQESPPSWLKRERVGEGGKRLGLEGKGQTLCTGGGHRLPPGQPGRGFTASQTQLPAEELHIRFPSRALHHPLSCPGDPQLLSQAKKEMGAETPSGQGTQAR